MTHRVFHKTVTIDCQISFRSAGGGAYARKTYPIRCCKPGRWRPVTINALLSKAAPWLAPTNIIFNCGRFAVRNFNSAANTSARKDLPKTKNWPSLNPAWSPPQRIAAAEVLLHNVTIPEFFESGCDSGHNALFPVLQTYPNAHFPNRPDCESPEFLSYALLSIFPEGC